MCAQTGSGQWPWRCQVPVCWAPLVHLWVQPSWMDQAGWMVQPAPCFLPQPQVDDPNSQDIVRPCVLKYLWWCGQMQACFSLLLCSTTCLSLLPIWSFKTPVQHCCIWNWIPLSVPSWQNLFNRIFYPVTSLGARILCHTLGKCWKISSSQCSRPLLTRKPTQSLASSSNMWVTTQHKSD